nr:RNA-directed DNA polymerase, eukaryota, reverse transcriptase zinc-binding domain protein [Tanacetum cinerariifolium]
VVDACLFNGIKSDSSLQISHLVYADDAIFMGQWSQCNIDTIIRVLDVFYHASGLRINMNKSNLMGIFVDSNKVKHDAAKIGGGWTNGRMARHHGTVAAAEGSVRGLVQGSEKSVRGQKNQYKVQKKKSILEADVAQCDWWI